MNVVHLEESFVTTNDLATVFARISRIQRDLPTKEIRLNFALFIVLVAYQGPTSYHDRSVARKLMQAGIIKQVRKSKRQEEDLFEPANVEIQEILKQLQCNSTDGTLFIRPPS